MEFVFGYRYSPTNVADQKKLIGVEGYVPPTGEALESLSMADLKSHLAHAGSLLLKTAREFLDYQEEVGQQSQRDYHRITRLREHYRDVCRHEWGAEWHETNHAYRRCDWCHKTSKRASGGVWVGE